MIMILSLSAGLVSRIKAQEKFIVNQLEKQEKLKEETEAAVIGLISMKEEFKEQTGKYSK